MRIRHLMSTALLGASLALNCPLTAIAETDPGIGESIRVLLAQDDLNIRGVDILTQEVIGELYQDHDFKPYWTNPQRIIELLSLIENAENHGLNPADYHVDVLKRQIARLSENPNAEWLAEEEILLTEALLRYGYHRRYGKVKASTLDPDINFRRETFKSQAPARTVAEAMKSASLPDFIELVAPSGPVYEDLQQFLANYRELAAAGGWPEVSEGPTLRLDDEGPRVAEIAARLQVTGEFRCPSAPCRRYDEALKEAVKDFQTSHALDADGIVGKQTIAAMNIPVEQRIDQLRLSLERLRWVNQEGADTLVAVNIAGFRVFFYEDEELAWSTRAAVGKHYRQTPVFRGDMAYLEFNPTWTIPPGILRNDTLPAIKKDPNYLASKNIRVIDRDGKFVDPSTVDWNQYTRGVPYTLRQDPGPNNSLGTVKFIFPNSHFVFLHDTPHRELFDRTERAFSSGCIRVEDPLRLAELVLNDPAKHSRTDLEGIVDSRKTQRINLETKMPVIIVYLTASVEPNGQVRFFRDIYNRDEKMLKALDGPVVIDIPDQT